MGFGPIVEGSSPSPPAINFEMNVSGVILAAGKGTRMKSNLPKVLHSVSGKKLISYALEVIEDINTKYVVVGHEAKQVMEALPESLNFVIQEEQKGTGHAISILLEDKKFANDTSEYILVLPGDVPMINSNDIKNLIKKVTDSSSTLGFLTSKVSNPFGYGRVIQQNRQIKIVEEKDCTEEERLVDEINSGIYCFEKDFLLEQINNLNTSNAQGEFYITDLIGIANNEKKDIVIVQVEEDSIRGINSMGQLNEVEDVLLKQTIQQFMDEGVYFQDPTSTYIDSTVKISAGTKVYANSHLKGETEIAGGQIGPFAHIRPGSELGENVKVGAFAETKKSKIGKGSKIPHLAYVGDAELGTDVNFSAGAITVNYDGKNKHKTDIEDGAFIGSDVMLVAPVTIGKESMIGAGSVITKDVPSKALGIERSDQKNIDGYMDRKKKND